MPTEFVAFCVNNCKMQICFVYFELNVCLHEYHISPMRLFYIDTNGTNACLPSCGDPGTVFDSPVICFGSISSVHTNICTVDKYYGLDTGC